MTIVVFAGGAACGLMAFSRLLAWTLQRYRELTYGYLTGMLVASVTVLWPWQQVDTYVQDLGGNTHALETHNVLPTSYQALTGQDPALIPVLLSLVAGFVIITGFEQLFRNTVD